MRIVITDSGLGGLSVCSQIEYLAGKNKSIENLELIYFNSLPDNGYGYNSLKDDFEKAEVFNSALISMYNKFHPDKILIACNTLSVIASKTEFVKSTNVEILGIVDFGVRLVLEETRKLPNSLVLILGTPTTVGSFAYQQRLIDNGISQNNIVGQPCFLLETEIQKSPFSSSTEKLIEKYVLEAKEKTKADYESVVVLLACTHYGYSLNLFDKILRKVFNLPITICNPNDKMAESVFINNKTRNSHEVSVEFYTQADISDEEKMSIGNLIKEKSPKTFSALMNCEADKSLFQFTRKL